MIDLGFTAAPADPALTLCVVCDCERHHPCCSGLFKPIRDPERLPMPSFRKNSMRVYGAVVITVSAVAVLAACGGSSASHDMSTTTPSASASPSTSATVVGGHNEQDAAFLEMMIPHHEQAIEMAAMVPSHTRNPQVRKLGAQIEAAQRPEISKMSAWLAEWNEGVTPSGMGHGGHDGTGAPGAGMMTAQQVAALDKAQGAAFDKRWLQMMIAHHEGAVTMAKQELASGENAQVKALAQSVIDGQTKEISQMKQMLG